ncbi:hypothetical protein BD769DRAFT_1485975 [Suillus cothurnatus]|nr:hypothetical protein BD769DRAFT_1485975 [Suillus cothurnatus]
MTGILLRSLTLSTWSPMGLSGSINACLITQQPNNTFVTAVSMRQTNKALRMSYFSSRSRCVVLYNTVRYYMATGRAD